MHRLLIPQSRASIKKEIRIADEYNGQRHKKVRQYIKKSRGYSGRVIDWKQGNDKQNSFLVYYVQVKDPTSYARAHKTILKKLGDTEFKNRTVAFGTFDIGRPENATHWIGLSGEGTDDLLMMHKNLQEKYIKEVTEYFSNRGEVIDLKDVRIESVAQYNQYLKIL